LLSPLALVDQCLPLEGAIGTGGESISSRTLDTSRSKRNGFFPDRHGRRDGIDVFIMSVRNDFFCFFFLPVSAVSRRAKRAERYRHGVDTAEFTGRVSHPCFNYATGTATSIAPPMTCLAPLPRQGGRRHDLADLSALRGAYPTLVLRCKQFGDRQPNAPCCRRSPDVLAL